MHPRRHLARGTWASRVATSLLVGVGLAGCGHGGPPSLAVAPDRGDWVTLVIAQPEHGPTASR